MRSQIVVLFYSLTCVLSAGCGGCCDAACGWGLVSDWSEEQRHAFHYSWQQRFVSWIVPHMLSCGVKMFVGKQFLRALLKMSLTLTSSPFLTRQVNCECGRPARRVVFTLRHLDPAFPPPLKRKRTTPAVLHISSTCPPPLDWPPSQQSTTSSSTSCLLSPHSSRSVLRGRWSSLPC